MNHQVELVVKKWYFLSEFIASCIYYEPTTKWYGRGISCGKKISKDFSMLLLWHSFFAFSQTSFNFKTYAPMRTWLWQAFYVLCDVRARLVWDIINVDIYLKTSVILSLNGATTEDCANRPLSKLKWLGHRSIQNENRMQKISNLPLLIRLSHELLYDVPLVCKFR